MLEKFEVRTSEALAGWPYEWVVGEAAYAVDPDDDRNAMITDLGLAPRDAGGLVRFAGDVALLRPVGGGNGRALLSVCNRGSVSIPFSGGLGASGVAAPPEITDALLLEQGWTLAWGGWQWDVDRSAGLAGLDAPLPEAGPGAMRSEFFPNVAADELTLADQNPMVTFASYPTADVDDPDAVLTVRTAQLGARTTIPRDRWRFTSPDTVTVEGGFRPFHWYELFYRSALAPVVGAGLLAIRDLGAYLRGDHEHVFASGVSQTGRFLREYAYQGMNLDERGRQVFDGLFIHIASARRGEFNRRHAQPSLLSPLMPEYGPPYDSASLLARQRAVGGTPKIMITNSAYEYWRGDGALVHQDAATGADLPEDPDVRAHLISGADHIGGAYGEFKSSFPVANPVHRLDPDPVLRALFTQLTKWACDGVPPSDSQVPRAADGTLAARGEVLARFPDAATPDPAVLPYTPAIDPGEVTWPLRAGAPRVALVSGVDDHGNEVAGIRLPEVAAGLAAYTGWNPRRPVDGLPDVLFDLIGSRLPALRDHELEPEAAIRKAARDLVARRLLLERDVAYVIDRALAESRT